MGNIENKDLEVADEMLSRLNEIIELIDNLHKKIEEKPGNTALMTTFDELCSLARRQIRTFASVGESYFSEGYKNAFMDKLAKAEEMLPEGVTQQFGHKM